MAPPWLVEGGYLTNDVRGAGNSPRPAYRQQIAEAIANGVRAYASSGGSRLPPAAVKTPHHTACDHETRACSASGQPPGTIADAEIILSIAFAMEHFSLR